MVRFRNWVGGWLIKLGGLIATDEYVFGFINAAALDVHFEPLGEDFERVWNECADDLYET
jgi:hypothetical protein